MREIRFRGKRIDNGEWIHGFYFMEPMGELPDCHYIMTEGMDNYEVRPATVGQFTGLHDKNGREIYEGDICKDARDFGFVVVWDDDNARFLGRGIGKQKEHIRYVGQEPAVEVIGNVHETALEPEGGGE